MTSVRQSILWLFDKNTFEKSLPAFKEQNNKTEGK